MTTATGSFSIEPNAEPFPGYRLEKRIGSGGYGEVWKATAPGGLSKAIKIIHGLVDGDRAVREMRSLDRVKSFNHPFLLSIERIEIVDGHLLIVTELADATLRDRFEECYARGLPGIPRDELLEYMRETADALDYLFDSHALQHLDIKPENLLLRGKHVKVADFGLLKDLQESCVSFVNGMTPKYSAPELFGGKPSPHSDQYSLAIVYQEMICGRLPFSGSNIASLASQHLHAAPDLSPLAPLERFAVGKALSKDPQQRFTSCRAFAERLMHRSTSIVMPGQPGTSLDAKDRSPAAQQKPLGQQSDAPCHDGHTIEFAAPEVRSLPRLLPPESPICYRPVVFIGLGGTGGRVLCKLRQLVSDRIGEVKDLPALQFLYVDTDEDALSSVTKRPGREGLDRDEILIMPLRQTQDYRRALVSKLDSLSRRWIYNVPRSLRTHGLRALGRIALLDHADRLLEAMRRAVADCTDTRSLTATAEQTGLNFLGSDPRVFVVASIAGGTGGGMVVDAGYAIRQVLAESGFADDCVCGLLTCSTAPGAGQAGMAAANAYASLLELRYFGQPGCDYPGEPACGLAGFRGDGPTFRSTYVFEAEAADRSDMKSGESDLLAEYLFLSTLSPSSALLDECRRLSCEGKDMEVLPLRTAGVCPLTAATSEDPALFAERLCGAVVKKWKVGIDAAMRHEQTKQKKSDRLYEAGDLQTDDGGSLRELGQTEMKRMGVNLVSVRQRIVTVMTSKLGLDAQKFLLKEIGDSLSAAEAGSSQPLTAVEFALRRIHAVVGVEKGSDGGGGDRESLADWVRPQARAIGAQLGELITEWILQLVDSGAASVDGASRAVAWVEDYVHALQQAAVEQAEIARRESESSAKALSSPECPSRPVATETLAATLLHHAEHHLNILIHESIAIALRAVDPFVSTVRDQLREIWRDLSQLATTFEPAKGDTVQINWRDAGGAAGPAAQRLPRMADLFSRQERALIEELDQAVERQFFGDDRRLRQVLAGGGHTREDLAAQMRAIARRIVLRAYYQTIYQFLVQATNSAQSEQLGGIVQDCLEAARPGLLDLGGAKRLLLSIPKQLDLVNAARAIEQVAHERVSVSIEQGGDVKFCYEVEDLPWEGIQTKLIRQRHDCRELASRLHTRINLDWTIV